MDSFLLDTLMAMKMDTQYCYYVVFPKAFSVQDLVFDKVDMSKLERYRCFSKFPHNVGDVVVVTSNYDQQVVINLAMIADEVDGSWKEISEGPTGVIIQSIPALLDIRCKVQRRREMERVLEGLRKDFMLEQEKILWEQLSKINPELAERIKKFRQDYPEAMKSILNYEEWHNGFTPTN